MRKVRKLHRLFLACVLLGLVLTMAPGARAISMDAVHPQTEIIEKDTTCTESRTVSSDLLVSGGMLNIGNRTLTVNGDLRLDGGEVKLNGGTLNVRGNLYINSNFYLTLGTVNVSGSVIHTGSQLKIRTGSVNIDGDYYIATPKSGSDGELVWEQSRGTLTTLYGGSAVHVKGDFYVHSRYGIDCPAGILTVAGDFIQKGDHVSTKFQSGTFHRVILNGEEPQTVTMESVHSSFGRLEIANPTGIVVTDHFSVRELLSSVGEVKIQSDSAVFGDVSLKTPLVTVTGDLEQTGDLHLNYSTLQLDGSLVHTDGEVHVEWGKLDISQDYCLATPVAVQVVESEAQTDAAAETEEETPEEPLYSWSYSFGKLVMAYPKGEVAVHGDFYMNASEGADCTYGTMTVSGNFTQEVNYSTKKFQARKEHKVVLNGQEAQVITLCSPESGFAKLEVENPQGIVVTDYFAADALRAAEEVKILTDTAAFENLTVEAPLVTITGDVIQDGDLNLKNSTVTISGMLVQTDGKVDAGKGKLDVAGDYYIATPAAGEDEEITWYSSYGQLVLRDAKGSVTVGGSFYVDADQGVDQTKGTLTVLGSTTYLEKPTVKGDVDTVPAISLHNLLPTVNYQQAYLSYYRRDPNPKSFNKVAERPDTVWLSILTGNYHKDMLCLNVADPAEVKTQARLVEDAMRYGYKACEKCFPDSGGSTSTTGTSTISGMPTISGIATSGLSSMVWLSQTGEKYHSSPNCSNMVNPVKVTIDQAIQAGREKCSKCY